MCVPYSFTVRTKQPCPSQGWGPCPQCEYPKLQQCPWQQWLRPARCGGLHPQHCTMGSSGKTAPPMYRHSSFHLHAQESSFLKTKLRHRELSDLATKISSINNQSKMGPWSLDPWDVHPSLKLWTKKKNIEAHLRPQILHGHPNPWENLEQNHNQHFSNSIQLDSGLMRCLCWGEGKEVGDGSSQAKVRGRKLPETLHEYISLVSSYI